MKMCSYRALTFAVAVMLVCLAAVAQADTMNILSNSDCQQSQGVWTRSASVYYNTEPSGNGASDDRPHCLEIAGGGWFWAANVTSHPILAGEQFSVAWDATGDSTSATHQVVRLIYQDGAVLRDLADGATITLPAKTSPHTWTTYGSGDSAVSFTALAGAEYIGKNVGVRITGGAGAWSIFDNVYLNYTSATPEPSTLVLVVTGVLGLLAYAWRKRK
jgi:hypothetical protein